MLLMGRFISGVDQDVVKVDNNTDIQHICKDGIDKVLESCRGIGEVEGHY